MGLKIHQQCITAEIAAALQSVCPFGALDYTGGELTVNAGCKGCKLCVKKGPAGAVSWEDEQAASALDKSSWRGIAVYADQRDGGIHPVTLELLGKAGQLARAIGHPVYALLIGSNVAGQARELLHYGADRAYVYDDPAFARFDLSAYANAFYDFIERVKPSSILSLIHI